VRVRWRLLRTKEERNVLRGSVAVGCCCWCPEEEEEEDGGLGSFIASLTSAPLDDENVSRLVSMRIDL